MAKTISLDFDGYYTEDDLPPEDHQCSGVYVVYRGDSEKLKELLYIGRSADAADRPSSTHHRYNSWCRSLQKNEVLYFSFADTADEVRAEAAMIFELQPKLNRSGKDGFHHKETTIITLGQNAGFEETFTVYPTDDD
jgi:hypothetical protein